jgi:hypothetical protein
MKLVTYLPPGSTHHPKIGAMVNHTVVDLDAAAIWAQGACSLSKEDLPGTMLELIYAGESKWEYAGCILAEVAKSGDVLSLKGTKHKPIAYPVSQVHLLPPIHPLTLRDAYAFENHVKAANENRGRTVPEEWYHFPVF